MSDMTMFELTETKTILAKMVYWGQVRVYNTKLGQTSDDRLSYLINLSYELGGGAIMTRYGFP